MNLAEALEEIVRRVVREELAPLRAEPAPEYRTRQQEAQRLSISVPTLDRLCREGLPSVRVGDSRRFRAAEVDAWLGARKEAT